MGSEEVEPLRAELTAKLLGMLSSDESHAYGVSSLECVLSWDFVMGFLSPSLPCHDIAMGTCIRGHGTKQSWIFSFQNCELNKLLLRQQNTHG